MEKTLGKTPAAKERFDREKKAIIPDTLMEARKLIRKSSLRMPLLLSIFCMSGCANTQHTADSAPPAQSGAPAQFGAPEQFGSPAQPQPGMQPLQPGQPPQKPARSISTQEAVMGGQPGANALPFNQPFRLGQQEYQFIAAKGKDYVGLEAKPAMRPNEGFTFFLVRYQVISHAADTVRVPNAAGVHILNTTNQQVTDIDSAATNANVQSGAATGMPDQLILEPEKPQIQTLAFQLPLSVNASELAILVTDPGDTDHVSQIVRLSN